MNVEIYNTSGIDLISGARRPLSGLEVHSCCKAWSQYLEPILWADYRPKGSLGDGTISIRKLSFIRTAELLADYSPILDIALGLPSGPGSAVIPNRLCTNLRRLKLRSFNTVPPEPPVVTLIRYNLYLTHLSFPDLNLVYDEVPAAISRLRHLQRLVITRLGWIHGPSKRGTLLLLQACLPLPDVTKLIMDYIVGWDDDDESPSDTKQSNPKKVPARLDAKTIIRESTIARFSQNPSARKIKLLHFPNCIEDKMNPLVVPLLTSGLLDLESCTIPWVERCRNTKEIERMVLEHCPKLKHLTYQGCELEDYEDGLYVDDEFAHAFVRGCLRLESFVSTDFSRTSHWSDRSIFSDLVAHHCNTLRVFELTECSRLFSGHQQAILAQCRHLRRFWVESTFPEGSTGLKFTDASRDDWVCMELRELRLSLNLHFDPDYGDDPDQDDNLEENDIRVIYANWSMSSCADTKPVELAIRRYFTQIGRLSKLETLELDIDRSEDTLAHEEDYRWELTLAYGKLAELAGLKNLRSLRLEADFWSKMGQPEVEFMHEHWPLLEEIVLVGKESELPTLPTLPHCQWLFKKRPQLVFTTRKQRPIYKKIESPYTDYY